MPAHVPEVAPSIGPRRSFKRLIVTATVAVVIGIPSWALWRFINGADLAAQRTSCNCNLKQIGLALHNYHDVYGSFPPAYVADAQGRPMHSWRVLILPFLDCNDLYEQYNFGEPWDSPGNSRLLRERPKVFDCVSRDEAAGGQRPAMAAMGLLACDGGNIRPGVTTSFAAAIGPDCVFRGSEPVTRDEISDSLDDTVMIGELSGAQIPWTKPEDIDIRRHPRIGDELGFSNGLDIDYEVFFLSAAGSIRRTTRRMPQATVDALFTRNGKEAILDDEP